MKKRIGTYIFLLTALFSVAANPYVDVDYGVDFESDNVINFLQTDMYRGDQRLSPWINFKFPSLMDMSLSIKGSAYIRYNPTQGLFRPILDVDLFSIKSPDFSFLGGTITFEIGRFNMHDSRGLIINQTVDGSAVHLKLPSVMMDWYGVYTGLQNFNTSSVMLSLDDYTEMTERNQRFYGLGARRAIFGWSTRIPDMFNKVDFHVDFIYQFDLRKMLQKLSFVKDVTVQELVDSWYGAIGISGAFFNSNRWFYNLDAVGEFIYRETAKKQENYLAGYLEGGVRFLPIPQLQFAYTAQYGTPNAPAVSEYRPISYKSAGIFYEGGFNNLLKQGLAVKWQAKDNIQLDTAGYAFILPKKLTAIPQKDRWEYVYKYTELSVGGTGVFADDLSFRAELFYGFNNVRDHFKQNLSLRLKLNVSF